MKYSLHLLSITLALFCPKAIAGDVQTWAESYGVGAYLADGTHADNQYYSSGNDYPVGIANMADGGVVVAGQMSFPSNTRDSGPTPTAAVVRFASDGSVKWQRSLEIPIQNGTAPNIHRSPTYVYGIGVDAQGNVLICGGKGNPDNSGQIPFVAKFAATGTLIWQNGITQVGVKMGDPPQDTTHGIYAPISMSVTPDGGVVIAGSQDFSNGNAASRPFIARFNNDGSLGMYAAYGPSSSQYDFQYLGVSAVGVSKDGNKYVMLFSYPQTGSYPYVFNGLTAIVTDTSGNVIAEKSLAPDQTRYSETPISIIATSDNGFASLSNTNGNSAVVRKFNSDISVETFEKYIYDKNRDSTVTMNSLAEAADETLLLGGHKNAAEAYSGQPSGGEDAMIMKLKADGTPEFCSLLGGARTEGAPAAQYGPETGAYVTQMPDGGYAFSVGTTSYGVDAQTNEPNWWVVKTDANRHVSGFGDFMLDKPLDIFAVKDTTRTPADVSYFSRISPSIISPVTSGLPTLTINDPGSFSPPDRPETLFQATPPFPAPPAPANGGISATTLTVNGSSQGSQVLAGAALRFVAQQSGTPADLNVRVQASTTPNVEGTWTDLLDGNGGRMTYDNALQAYVLDSKSYPNQTGVSFRAISSAGGYPDSISNVVGPLDLSASKPPLGKTKLHFTANSGVCDMYFRATESNTPSGIAVRIQSTTASDNEGSWTDLNNASSGNMTQSIKASEFLLLVNNYPAGNGIYFRAVATAPGYADSISNIMGPYNIASVVPPTVKVVVGNGLSGSGAGTDADHPIVLSEDSAGFGASVQSGNALRTLQLQVDGKTVAEYPNPSNDGNSLFYANYTPEIGAHVYEAVAVDTNGARRRAGTGAVYVLVVPSQSTAKALRVASSTAASEIEYRPGHVYHVANSGGDWYDANTWRDENGNPRVPGPPLDGPYYFPRDLVIIGSATVVCNKDVVVWSVELGPGGVINGNGAAFDVDGTMTLFGGSFQGGVTLNIFGTANLINAADVNFVGHLLLHERGTLNVHGSAGLTGADQFDNYGTVNWLAPLAIPVNAATDPAAAVRIIEANSVTNSGLLTGTITALIGSDGSSLIGTDGSSIVAAGGGNIISRDGAGIASTGSTNLIGSDGSSLIGTDGSSIVAAGGGNFQPAQNTHAKGAAAPPGFVQTGGEIRLGAMHLAGPVTLKGGVLSGTGLVLGDLTNNGGYISPGHSAGGIGVVGNFSQAENGTMVLEAGGAQAGQFDTVQVGGTAALGGKLDFKLINGYKPDAAQTFNPISYNNASGSFDSVSSNAQVTVNSTGVIAKADAAAPQPQAAKLLNISTRMSVQTGENVLIGGFIVTGPAGSTKKVMIRGLGPSLAQQGVPDTLPDPLLELHAGDGGVVTANDDWQQGDTSQIPAGFGPASSKESVIVATLTVGSAGYSSYTAILKGAHDETGNGLCEVYDLESDSSAQLANISTRGQVQTGDSVMIGGVIVGGSEPAKVLVRAIGPSLKQQGVNGALGDTTLELHDANGGVISNDDWRETQESEIKATTIPPTSDRESAIVHTLVPGNYTAVVRGKNGGTGVGLVEAYNLQ